ncbi:MAG: 2-deoxy-5-keto-D-gluconate 6-phosphate aldolase domain-containing protein [Bacteriovoracia bacterium]
MASKNLGYGGELFILAFDHRGSFQSKLFGIKGTPTPEETKTIASYKKIIYDGFKRALSGGVPRDRAGILVDEQFGAEIVQQAKTDKVKVANPAEKSGQDEFDFEYGAEFGAHIEKFAPDFVKVLVRYNPESTGPMNANQTPRLKQLSEYCHANNRKYLFELLVPATPEQLQQVGGDTSRFDKEMRPKLMVKAMQELVAAGVEPDIWKLEGLDTEADCRMVATQARQGGRDQVGVVVLGRGENDAKVTHWLKTAAKVPAFTGFAIGRSIFWEPLKAVKEGKCSREEAAMKIAENYQGFCKTWLDARK